MMFDWWTDKGLRRCMKITPKRLSTLNVYLDEYGLIDTHKNPPEVLARIGRCDAGEDPFRP